MEVCQAYRAPGDAITGASEVALTLSAWHLSARHPRSPRNELLLITSPCLTQFSCPLKPISLHTDNPPFRLHACFIRPYLILRQLDITLNLVIGRVCCRLGITSNKAW